MRRRTFLQAASTLALGACAARGASEDGLRGVERVGVQLYTVRDRMAEDVPRTLAEVARAGYLEVETAGTGNLTPSEFAAALKAEGLTAPAAHVPINMVIDSPQQLLEAASVIGYRYLVVPWLPESYRSARGYAKVAQALNTFGEQTAAAGITTAYHNHAFEFERLVKQGGEQTAFDFLLAETDPKRVQFELDLYWVAHAGADSAYYLANHTDRIPLCHVKDRNAAGEMVDVGSGVIDFPALFALGTGLRHYFVEHDNPKHSLRSIQSSFRAVNKMRF